MYSFLIPILLLFSCEKEENLIEQNLIEFLKGKVYQKDIPEGKGMLSLTYLFSGR